jgi:adenosylcobinamide-GDP ribazoletransferase
MLLDAWRLALGTLTAVPVAPPIVVDRRRAGMATLALGAAVLGNRAFHLDGLSDTVDGMAASHDRERSLEVMKSGTSGPAGVVAVVLVLRLHAAGLVAALASPHPVRAAVLAGCALCVSRAALATCCTRGVPSARPGGLSDIYTRTVARPVVGLMWLACAAVLSLAGAWAGLAWWRGALSVAAALAVAVVVARAVRRLGGVTGDVFGASTELALATLLVGLS